MFKLFQSKSTFDFSKDAEWINSKPISFSKELKGHIVVLDFWTYCCINCVHMLADIKKLEEKYGYNPVIFIGVHSAKFENEDSTHNIQSAISRYGIKHPVLRDKNRDFWKSFNVSGWPTIIILDTKGKVIYQASGEGQALAIEEVIDTALEKAKRERSLAVVKANIELTQTEQKTVLSFPGKIEYSEVFSQLFIADTNHNRILATQLDGNIAYLSSEIGSGKQGLKDGSFETAEFNHPQGMLRKRDLLYVADTENHAIRVVDLKQKTVKTLAGTGNQSKGSPLKGPCSEMELNSPWDIVQYKNYLFIAMAGSHQIYRLDLLKQEIEPYAGTGEEGLRDGPRRTALFAQPSGLALEEKYLYVADSETSSIRIIDLESETVSTLIGKGLFDFGNKDGKYEEAQLQHPLGVHYEEDMLYIADTYNHAIKMVYLNAGQVSTIIKIKDKDQNVCMIDDNGLKDCHYLPLFEPNDMITIKGNLYIADTNNHLIRMLDMQTRELVTVRIKK